MISKAIEIYSSILYDNKVRISKASFGRRLQLLRTGKSITWEEYNFAMHTHYETLAIVSMQCVFTIKGRTLIFILFQWFH